MIVLPEKCLRERSNCNPLSQIASDDGVSFYCCGLNDGTWSKVLKDIYTVCFKGPHEDSIVLDDKRDLIHNASVLLGALAVIEETA